METIFILQMLFPTHEVTYIAGHLLTKDDEYSVHHYHIGAVLPCVVGKILEGETLERKMAGGIGYSKLFVCIWPNNRSFFPLQRFCTLMTKEVLYILMVSHDDSKTKQNDFHRGMVKYVNSGH